MDARNDSPAARPPAARHAGHAGRPEPSILKAIAWMTVALFAFTLTAIAMREVGKTMLSIEAMFYRSLVSLILLLIGLKLWGVTLASLRTRQPVMQMARALAHFAGQWSWMTAVVLIPLVELFAIEFTVPLWVAVLAPLLLGERLTVYRLAAAALGFLGVLVIIQPGSTSMSLGTVLAIFCAMMFALNLIGTRYLTRQDSALTIILFMTVNHTVLSFLICTVPALFSASARGLPIPDGYAAIWLFTLGAASLAAHFGLARAISYADVIVVAPMDFMRLPLIALVGMLLYAEQPGVIVLIGAAIVLFANILNLWGERRTKR